MRGEDMQDLLDQFRETNDFTYLTKYYTLLSKNEKLGELKPRYEGMLIMRILLAYIKKIESRAKNGIPTTEHSLRIDWNDSIHDTFTDDKIRLFRTYARMKRTLHTEAKPSEKLSLKDLETLMRCMEDAFVRSYQQTDLLLDQMVELMGRNHQWKGLIPVTSDRGPMDYVRQFEAAVERGEFHPYWDVDNETKKN